MRTKQEPIDVIRTVFDLDRSQSVDIRILEKGMTNKSFLFSINNIKYILRAPGEGTDQLIDREQEQAVYAAIKGRGLCDEPVFIDPKSGYKITRFLENVRTCNPYCEADVRQCMGKLKAFHEMELTVRHEFDVFEKIRMYEDLWGSRPSIYLDYDLTKERIWELQSFIKDIPRKICLTHIDAVPDNFLFHTLPDGTEELQLTDWEYSGMQDPHMDIAMFSIYSLYNKQQIDSLIDIYFQNQCDTVTRFKIYAYVSICGLLWSNWCEFKRNLGIEFGDYASKQYEYAKEYYHYAVQEIK